MAGPEAADTAAAAAASAFPQQQKQPQFGPIGDASQLVEAALQARVAASQDQQFATTKTLFFALSSLCGALRLELRLRKLGQAKPEPEVRADCEACTGTLQGLLANKKLELTAPFCRIVADCLSQAFELCESLNAVGAVLDLHKLLDNKKALPEAESKMAVLEALGEISRTTGLRVVSLLPESVAAAAKHLKQPEPLVRAKAVLALRGLVDGAAGMGSSIHAAALKAATKAAADRCPEVRVEAYNLCLSLAEAAPNLVAFASPVPLEALVALCVRGLDDESPAARLAAAAATGAALSAGVEGSAAENERLGVIAARDQDHDDDDDAQGGGGGIGGGKTFANKLKEMGAEMKVGMSKLNEKKIPELGNSLTADKVVQFLSELFRRATTSTPQSREYMAGVAEAFVCLWRRPYMLQRVNSATAPKLVGAVLDLLDTDCLPQGAAETGVVRTAVEYIVREGISVPLPELGQQLVAREMLQILSEVAGSAPPASGFPPLYNEHQIQVCLVELSHLTRALGQACAALKDTLAESLSALLAHPSYGVRFEAAVALASLGSALPWCAAGLLQQCLDEIQQQYDALMAEGILPASPPTTASGAAAPSNLSSSPGAAPEGALAAPTASASASASASELTAEGVVVTAGDAEDGNGVRAVGEGEPDADLDLDGDVTGESAAAGGPADVTKGTGASASSSENNTAVNDGNDGVFASAGGGLGGGGRSGAGSRGGRSTVASKRLRLLLLHGNSSAASLLLQVAKELPMGIPSKVAENSFIAAEKLIRVQFPADSAPRASTFTTTNNSNGSSNATSSSSSSSSNSSNTPSSSSHGSPADRSGDQGQGSDPPTTPEAEAFGRGEKATTSTTGAATGGGGRGRGGQQPMGVVCSCVRTGWSLMSSLFCVGEEWAEGKADRLMELWALCMTGAGTGTLRAAQNQSLRGLDTAHELILLDASTRALLWFLRSCPNTLCMAPDRLALALNLMESAVDAVEGRLKSPLKKQGVICRTLLKALLMECFAWLPPNTFPSSSARLFKWSLDHLKMYTLNDVQSSLLPELLHPDDAVLSVASSAKVPMSSGVGSLVEGEDSDRVLAQVALVSGVTIGPQERDAMVCSAEVWAGRGPSPARKRRDLENSPPTPLHASSSRTQTTPPSSSSDAFAPGAGGGAGGAVAGGWRRPLPSSASINVRLLDAAVQVFAASFGQQTEESKLEGVSGLVEALPEYLQASAASSSAAAATAPRASASGSAPGLASKKDAPFGSMSSTMSMSGGILLSDEDRKKRDRRNRLAVLNVCSALLAALKSMPPLPEGGTGEGQQGSGSPVRHNIDLPWVTLARDILLELLSSDDTMARRAAAEGLALMGLKVGDGYAVYLIQDLLKILRKRPEKKSKKPFDRDSPVNANRRAGAMFALACLKRTMGSQVVLNWFWRDVQRELSVGGGVVQPARTWGLHAACLLVKGLEAESNPTQYSEVQEMVKYLSGVVELLEAHFLGSWTPVDGQHGSKRSSGSSKSSSAAAVKEGQAVAADAPGLAAVLANLLCTLLPALQGLQPSREVVGRLMAMWGVLRHDNDSRVKLGCLELVELLAMFAPGDVPDALPEIMPFVQGVLLGGVGGTSPECLSRAAMCVKLIAARTPGAVEAYRPELELYSCLESVLGSLTWEGAPTWRGVVVSRDVEKHFGGRVEAARHLEVAIDTIAKVDQAGYRPLHWLLFGKALLVGTGHVQHPISPRRGNHAANNSGGGGGGEDGAGDGGPGASPGFGKGATSSWSSSTWTDVVQGARTELARFASPLASSRWQVKRTAVRGCVMVLSTLESGSSHGSTKDERVACLDVNKARRLVTRYVRTLPAESSNAIATAGSDGALTVPARPFWALVPPLLCLYLEDMVTLACAAATASTDDSELLELQEAGVMMLTEVVRIFAQVPDSDADELGVVVVLGKTVRAPTLALELSISQITGAARPALGCKVSPRLAQRGCELVVTLVREGLVKDTVVLRRLVRQVMPEEIVSLSAKQLGHSKESLSRRRVRASRSPSPRPAFTPTPRGTPSHAPARGTAAGGAAVSSSEGGLSASTSPTFFGKEGDGDVTEPIGTIALSPEEMESLRIKAAIEASYRPEVSEVYGVHVPLGERAARLQCLAVLRLVAGGEDDAALGGGSGSGAIIPDTVRKGLMDALGEKMHLRALGLHWLANVKDAVRLNQGDACGLWPCAEKRNTGAGLTYPPGVKASLAKGPLQGRWPVMAAAAAAELAREGSGLGEDKEAAPFLLSVSVCGLMAAEEGLRRRRLGGASRRHGRSSLGFPGGGSGGAFANGSSLSSRGSNLSGGGGGGRGDEEDDEEQDEGQMAEDASLMFLTTIRCLFSRPELLGDPSSSKAFTKNIEKGVEEGQGRADGANGSPLKGVRRRSGVVGVPVPVSTVVRAVRTLTSPPFLRRAGAGTPQGEAGGDDTAAIPTRLQLAAIAALRAVMCGDGEEDAPGYVLRATAAAVAVAAGGGEPAGFAGAVEELDVDGSEAAQADAEPLALWEAVMGGVIGGLKAVLPAAFDLPPPLEGSEVTNEVKTADGNDAEHGSHTGFAAFSAAPPDTGEATTSAFTAEFPSDGNSRRSNPAPSGAGGSSRNDTIVSNPPVSGGADGMAVIAAAAAFGAAAGTAGSSSISSSLPRSSSPFPSSDDESASTTMMLAALLPLLARLPPICPEPRLPSTLPSLLLLAVKVLGAVSGRSLGLAAKPSGAEQARFGASPGGGVRGAGGAGGAGDVDVAASAREAEAAVDFVRSCVIQVLRHGTSAQQLPGGDAAGGAAAALGLGPGENGVGKAEPGADGAGHVAVAADASTAPEQGDEITISGTGETAAADRNDGDDDDDDDDWGDDDFQGAEDDFDFQGAEDADDDQSVGPAIADTLATGTVQAAQEESAAAGESPLGETTVGETEKETGEAEEGTGSKSREDESTSPCDEGEQEGDGGEIGDNGDGDGDNGDDEPVPEISPADANADADGEVPGPVSLSDADATATTTATAKCDEGASPSPEVEATEAEAEPEPEPEAPATAFATSAEAEGAAAATPPPSPSPPPPAITGALSMVLAAGRAVNELLTYLLTGRGAVAARTAAIAAAAKAWGAIALTVPREMDNLAGPLRAALTAPVDQCSVAVRLALLQAVAVTVKAAAAGQEGWKEEGGGASSASTLESRRAAAAALLRLLAPHALEGLRLEVGRAAAGRGPAAGGLGLAGEEPQEACLLEGVHVAQLAFQAAPQASHGALLGLLLPLYSSALALDLPTLSATVGQALLLTARSSAAAFKEAVAYVGPAERQALEGAVRAAIVGRGASAGAGDGGGRGGTGSRVPGRKLDLSQYSSRG
eukprot:g12254.t1